MAKKPSYHHGDLRRALMAATALLVEKHGPEGFTLRAAARQAGVSDGAPYHHFADKDALLAEVAREGFEMLRSAMEAAGAEHPAAPRLRSQAMGVAYVRFAAAHPGHFRTMFTAAADRRKRHPALEQAARAAFELVRDALMAGLSNREANLPTEHVLAATWGLVHGLAFLAIDGQLPAIGVAERELEALAWGAIHVLDSTAD